MYVRVRERERRGVCVREIERVCMRALSKLSKGKSKGKNESSIIFETPSNS